MQPADLSELVASVHRGERTPHDALRRVTPDDLERLVLGGGSDAGERPVLATGSGVSPGVAAGRIAGDVDSALDLLDEGEPVVLVRPATVPADGPVLQRCAGVVTTTGGAASHAAVVARGWGIPAVVGVALELGPEGVVGLDGRQVRWGQWVVVDGSAGAVGLGRTAPTRGPGVEGLDELLGWADDARAGHLGVLANADTAEDAVAALGLGADGIGLCRTEHQFLLDGRLDLLQRALSGTGDEDRAPFASEQRDAIEALLAAADGRPVSIRLLDAPASEYLPADPAGRRPGVDQRGVRLTMTRPELYEDQIRAIAEAVARRKAAGGDPRPRLVVPFVVAATEVARVRDLATGAGLDVPVDAMVETPRAALEAGDLAGAADGLLFGSNDLTALVLGVDREDDSTARWLRDSGALEVQPFASLDRGVGDLIRLAVGRARAVAPELPAGLCGEHGGDPASIAVAWEAGLSYVSCSPYRVLVARLAAARAVLAATRHAGPPRP